MATARIRRPKSGHLRSVPSPDPSALARIGAWHSSPQGVELREAGAELENGLALLDVLLQALETSPGDEHEATALRIALERLEQAANHLDTGDGIAARAYQPAEEGAQS